LSGHNATSAGSIKRTDARQRRQSRSLAAMRAAVTSTDVANLKCATYEVGGQRLAGFRGVS
jgi:hypothetical protein